MQKISTFFTAGILVLFISGLLGTSVYGESSFMVEAIKHAEEAKTHKSHSEHVEEHAKLSLKYIKKAEIEAIEQGNSEGRVHITSAIQHLYEAIQQAKAGHTIIATEYVTDAVEDMYKYKAE